MTIETMKEKLWSIGVEMDKLIYELDETYEQVQIYQEEYDSAFDALEEARFNHKSLVNVYEELREEYEQVLLDLAEEVAKHV